MPLRAAELLLAELGVTEPGEIDLEAIAYCTGATIKVRTLHSCEARIVGNRDRAIISIDPRMPERRRRFSIAHELGHWEHHRGKCLQCRAADMTEDPDRAVGFRERAANAYAADLLMPQTFIADAIGEADRMTTALVRQVAEMFDVSMLASAIRLVESNRFPVILCIHRKDGTCWHRTSRNVPSFWFPTRNLDKATPAYGMLHENAAESRFAQKVEADDWFDRPSASRFEIKEQSFRVHGDDVATILTLPGDMVDL